MTYSTRLRTAEPPISPSAIPQSLRDIPRWICWDYMDYGDGKKPRKVPVSAGGDFGTNYNDPSAWRTFSAAMKEANDRGGLGIGFVFSEQDDIVGVDLDNCYDEQQWLKPWAKEVCEVFAGAFCELTPSGMGLHFIGKAPRISGRTRVELPGGAGAVERYSENRWFTFTGNPTCEGDVVDISSAMDWLEARYFPRQEQFVSNVKSFESDVELDIELARVCLERIGRNRASIGDDWRAVGYACKGTSESLRDDWITWSSQWHDFDRDECIDRWSRFDSRSGVGTLVYMAVTDSGATSVELRKEACSRLGRVPAKVAAVEADDEQPTPTLLDAIDAWRKQEETPALPTGIESLDRLFDGGLPLGQMTALAAAPGVGKSALALHLVIECLVKNGGLVATWCLGEMTKAALAARAITNFGGMEHDLTLQEVIKKRPPSSSIADAMATLATRMKIVEAPLMIDRIERAVAKDKPKLLVVDYVQLVQSVRNFQDSTGEIVDCLRKLRQITTANNMATLLVTNIAKGCDQNTEIGNIGKGSNQIDFDVDNFLFGHRSGETLDDGGIKIEWRCKKLRQGQMSDVGLWFYGKYQRFVDGLSPVVGEIEEFKSHSPKAVRSGSDWGAF
jgi:KaiC/GvpD/RAD55 family RecA-like ATPase